MGSFDSLCVYSRCRKCWPFSYRHNVWLYKHSSYPTRSVEKSGPSLVVTKKEETKTEKSSFRVCATVFLRPNLLRFGWPFRIQSIHKSQPILIQISRNVRPWPRRGKCYINVVELRNRAGHQYFTSWLVWSAGMKCTNFRIIADSAQAPGQIGWRRRIRGPWPFLRALELFSSSGRAGSEQWWHPHGSDQARGHLRDGWSQFSGWWGGTGRHGGRPFVWNSHCSRWRELFLVANRAITQECCSGWKEKTVELKVQ